MPSKSKKQANLMRAAAHNPAFAKKVGVPQSVAKDFAAADKKQGKFKKGGAIKIANPNPRHGKLDLPVYGVGRFMKRGTRKKY